MKKILIYLCLIIIFFLIFFSYKTFENFNNEKYIPQYVGPIIFYDYNDNKIGSYPDENIWPSTFEKKDGKYINLIGAGDPFQIKFPKSKKGDIGPKGYRGLQGDIGIKGKKGENITGPKGPDGNKGPIGNRGETGSCDSCPKGEKGDKGNKGQIGDKGAKGITGDRPLKNEAPKGDRGPRGNRGIKGTLKGDNGSQGPMGPRGSIGLPGIATAKKGKNGNIIPDVVTKNGDYLLINREEDINSPKEIKIGNNLTKIDISSHNVYLKNLCINKSGYEELCINNEDIRRLNEFNNPECSCPNGVVVNKDECAHNGIISCKKCDDNYYLKTIRRNAKWKKNFSTNICESCASAPSCPGGKYLSGCGSGIIGTCVPCPACPSGQHRVNCNKTSSGTCVNNVCKCNNGTGATGKACPNHNDQKCTSCNGGYYKNGNTCVPCSHCGAGQYQTRGCHTNHNRTCGWKQCTCTDGTGAHGTSCPHNGHHKCISCKNNYYSLRNGLCTYNQVLFYQNSNYSGQLRWIGGPSGTYTNLNNLKYNYSSGKKMEDTMTSFRKDPNAKVTFYQHKDGRGKCVDVTGTGNVGNVGSWWNDRVSSVGWGGTPCSNHRSLFT